VPDNPAKEAFTDLFSHLEHLETVTGALLQFLKDNGFATDEKLAPYLEQASKASDVRMRAARARMDHLFSADETAKPAAEAVPSPNKQEQQNLPRQREAKDQPATKDEAKNSTSQSGKTPLSDTGTAARSAANKPVSAPQPNEPSEIVAAREAAKNRPENRAADKRTGSTTPAAPQPEKPKKKDAA